MRNTTKGHGFLGAVVSVIVVAGLMLLLAAFLLLGYFGGGGDEVLATGLILVYAAVCLAVAVGAVVVLVQRLREIKGGEEDEARKY